MSTNIKGERKKNLMFQDSWILYSGTYQLHWKNGEVDKVIINGVEMKVVPCKPSKKK